MDLDIWLWIYVAAMAAGAILFFIWGRNPKGVPHYEYAAAMFIPIWSGLAYTAAAFGQGVIEYGGHTVYLTRYADWIVTTPLLLMALVWTAFFYAKKDYSIIAALVGADVIMILSGLMADLSRDESVKWVWFTIGCVSLAILIYMVWFRMRGVAYASQGETGLAVGRAYDISAGMLSVLWLGYPLIWWLGPSGTGLLPKQVEVPLYVVLPIISKVGFSIVDLRLLRGLGERRPAHSFEAHRKEGFA